MESARILLRKDAGTQCAKKCLAEFAAAAAKKIESCFVATCAWQNIPLRLRVCELCAFRRTRSALSRLQPFRRKAPKGIFDGLRTPKFGRPSRLES